MQNFTSKEILTQLSRVLASSQLSGSNVLSEFLNFIVRETLSGRGDELKEYTIGVHALKKDSDFNPQLDSIVRIHAGRLRRALKEYYYEEGATDSIAITIPKGSYVPIFETRSTESPLFIHTADPEADKEKRKHVVREHTEGIPFLAFNEHAPIVKNTSHKPSVAVLPYKLIGSGEALDNFVKG